MIMDKFLGMANMESSGAKLQDNLKVSALAFADDIIPIGDKPTKMPILLHQAETFILFHYTKYMA